MLPARTPFVVILAALSVFNLHAEVRLSALFSDNAVLQSGMEVPVWGTARDGERVTVGVAGQKATAVAENGKWTVKLPPLPPGGPFTLTASGDNTVSSINILVGEVWLCSGQSNMARTLVPPESAQPRQPCWQEAAAAADYPEIRQFRVGGRDLDHPADSVEGKWEICTPDTAGSFSGVGYFFARDLFKARKVPVGLITAAVGATGIDCWLPHDKLAGSPALKSHLEIHERSIAAFPAKLAAYQAGEAKLLADYAVAVEAAQKANLPAPRKPTPPGDPAKNAYRPSAYFNGKIAPLQPYAIRGVLWYQGESNSGHAREYGIQFPALIAGWRELWHRPELPFLFVQLPQYVKTGPEIRDVQLMTWKTVPHTAMVVTIDCGDAEDIHPPDKAPVGARLALAARGVVYGEKIEYSGPLFEALKIEGAQAILSFQHIGAGLLSKDGELKDFVIAGADRKFLPAKAEIRGDTVVVSSPGVPAPVAVRYAWQNVPVPSLSNREGLPASPFRTDDWP